MDEPRRKAFLFNVEWYEVLMEYGSDVRLEVYEAIIKYATSGILSELKPQAKMAFSFIKRELDYNERQYQSVVEKRREAGKKGGKPKQTKQMFANGLDAKQTKQMFANADIYEYDNDIYSSTTFQNISTTTVVDDVGPSKEKRELPFMADADFVERFFEKRMQVEQFCMGLKVSVDELKTMSLEIINEWSLKGQSHTTEKDAISHLINHLRAKIKSNTRKNGTASNNNGHNDDYEARQQRFKTSIAAKLAGGDNQPPDIDGYY